MNILKIGFFICILIPSICFGCQSPNKLKSQPQSIQNAIDLSKRILPDNYEKITFKEVEASSKLDFFEIESVNNKIQIGGNNTSSMASGLYYYLKNYCNAQISLNYNQLNLPKKLPLVPEKIRIETPFKYRYFFNYCTYGYSMPWWNWDRWEKMIDYMALQGVNMPLATIGQEAVWQKVYKELGMTDKQISDFFVGPAYLPWGWMGNIDGVGGPLPNNWIQQRAELQKKILARMRSLGMKPVLQGFTGHVPAALKKLYPKSNIFKINDWAGIPGTMFLDPTDSLFQTIGNLFIKKQTELFGTDHLYDADCFIEVNPPSKDPEFLKKVSKAVYHSMAAADPEATWVIQGWFFFFQKNFWQPEQGRAFLGAIPKDKVIILDLYGEKNPTWDKTEAFYGQPWIWNVICNGDQKLNMSGDLKTMQNNFQEAYRKEGNNNLKGIGVIPEGVGYNPIIQEFLFEKAWNQDSISVNDWVANYVKRRYNSNNKNAQKAWQILLNTVYSRTRTMWSPLITTPRLMELDSTKEDIRHVRKEFEVTDKDPFAWDFDVYKFYSAAKYLLNASNELKNNPGYKFDLTNVYRELLQSYTHQFIHKLSVAFHDKDPKALKVAGDQLLKLFDDLETITGTNENFMLGKWLEEAKSWGNTAEERNYYEWNARTIITIWQPWENGGLRDYAAKAWNGMFSGYYKPRWKLLIDFLENSIKDGSPFDAKAYEHAVRKIDFRWTHSHEIYPSKPIGNVIDIATRLSNEYVPSSIKN